MADTSKKSRKFWVIFGFFLGITFAFMAARYLNSEKNKIDKTVAQQQIENLTVSNFASANISQWTNDAGYLSQVDYSQLKNGGGLFLDYRPNNTQCANNQILRYDLSNSRWICGDEGAGGGTSTWGNITGTIANQADLKTLFDSKLTSSATFGGDVSGNYAGLSVNDDSHSHTGTTISGLTPTDFASQNISQWTNDANFVSGLSFSQITNGSGVFLDYRPNNLACTEGQVLKYDAALNHWICGIDSGAGAVAWGDISGNLADQIDLNSALTNKLGTTASFGGDVSGTYDTLTVANDSHDHTGATISGLAVADFASPNVSQWTNNAGYITDDTSVPKNNLTNTGALGFTWATTELAATVMVEGENISLLTNNAGFITGLTHAQVTNGTGVYSDYRPNNVACSQDQVLKYDAGLNRWVCASDVGATSFAWGSITGTLSNQTDLNNAITAKLNANAAFGGDVSGSYGAIVVTNDSHDHTAATISGLTPTDFTSQNISQWTNDANFIAGLTFAQVTNGSGVYLNYKPNNVACNHDQTLKYDAALSRWACADDNGAGTIAWGSITGTLSNQGDLSTALSSKLNLTASFGGDVTGTYDNLAISNDSHSHTGATISGLAASNFTSANISQWTNDSGFITGVDVSQVANGAGKYSNYKPNNTACTNNQVLKYDTANTRWICGDDNNSGGGGGGTPVDVTKTNLQVNKVLYESTLSGTTASFDLQNIDQSYEHLMIIVQGRTTIASTANELYLYFNNDTTASNYRGASAWNGSTNGGQAADAPSFGAMTGANSPANEFGVSQIYIQNYASTTNNKSAQVTSGNRRDATNIYKESQFFSWENNAAINRITVVPGGGNSFVTGSRIQIIGVKSMDIVTDVTGGGGVATIGTMTTSPAFADSTADDDWLGLGASAARIEFDDQTTDEINLLDANVGIGQSAPTHKLDVNGNIGLATSGYLNFGATDGTSGYGIRDNAGVIEYKDSTGDWVALNSLSGGIVASVTTVQTRTQGIYSTVATGDGTELTPLTLVLTPKSAGNKVILEWVINGEVHEDMVFNVSRNGTVLPNSNNGTNRWSGINSWVYDHNQDSTPNNATIRIIDENSLATASTYRLLVRSSYGSANNFYLNRTVGSTGADSYEALLSTGVATEIGSGGGGSGGGSGTVTVGSMTGTTLFADGTADDGWLGLGASVARIEFDDQTTDEINLLAANVGIGQSTPTHTLDVNGNIGIATSGYLNFGATDGTSGYGIRDNSGTLEYKNSGGAWAALGSGSGTPDDYLLIRDEKPSGTQGGTFNAGSWVTRDLNTEVIDTGNIATISGNQITLPAGTYRAHIIAPAMGVGAHRAKLYNVTAGADLLLGTSIHSLDGNYVQNNSEIDGEFTLSGTTVLEVRHRATYSKATWGLGHMASFGEVEVFTVAEFFKINGGSGGGSGLTTVGSMTGTSAFADSTADNDWLGLGASAGRIEFDDQATDEVNFLDTNIGIGTATPAAKLHIYSAGGTNSGINLQITNAASYGTIDFNTPAGLVGQFTVTGSSFSNGFYTADEIALSNYATNGSTALVAGGGNGYINFATGGYAPSNERMRILANGNVAIGATTANHKLDVSGNVGISASGYLNFGTTDGTTGYGIRDNGGKVEAKNSGGTWTEVDDNPSWAVNPDKPPASANAMDDEFNDGSIDAKWTTYTDVASNYSITEANKVLELKYTSNVSNTNRYVSILQAAPAGNWKFRTKLSIEGTMWTYVGGGMLVRNASSNKNLWYNFLKHGSMGEGLTGYLGRSTGVTVNSEVDLTNTYQQTLYLETEYDGTYFYYRMSTTGTSYQLLYTETVAGFLGGAPEYVGVMLHPYSTLSGYFMPTVTVDWFRRIQ